MALLSIDQARVYAQRAGFSGSGINVIVAIARAESSLNSDAQNRNIDNSLDRGILQINSRWHPEVSDSCAYNPECSFRAAFRISNSGTSFSPWVTYTSGAYRRFMTGGNIQTSNAGSKAWYDYPVTTRYGDSGVGGTHYAIDFGTPQGTPFFFLESGTIKQAGYKDWGGEVFLQPDDGGPQELVYHLDDITTYVGDHVTAGEVVGYSGGQNTGGKHPTMPQWSSGPHTHFGLFERLLNGRIWGPDPTPLVNSARTEGLSASDTGRDPLSDNGTNDFDWSREINRLINKFPGFEGIVLAVDRAESFPGYQDHGDDILQSALDTTFTNFLPFAFRALVVSVGIFLIIGLIYNLVQKGSSITVQNGNVMEDVA